MKIAWFTPFSSKSAIGMVSKDICEKLSERADVDIWTHDSKDVIPTFLNVVSFAANDDLSRLEKYDHIIYNMGNFTDYHKDIYDVSQQYKGVVILHDQTMLGFWAGYYISAEAEDNGDAGYGRFIDLFRNCYGRDVAEYAETAYHSGHPMYEYKDMHKFHLIEPVIKNAKGVFSHAGFFCDEIKKYYNGPAGYSYLPCSPAAVTESNHEIFEIIEKGKKQQKKIVVSNGVVHYVKQIDKITSMLTEHPEIAENIMYIVVGGYGGEYGDTLKKLSENSLKDCLYLMGYQPYEVMNKVISCADMCINLRYPNSEVCSLSLLEQMSYGKAVLVIDSGVYGEMPDDAVIKVKYNNLANEITAVFKNLISRKEDFLATGVCAKKFVENMCSTSTYCDRLLDFIGEIDVNVQIGRFQNLTIRAIADKMNNFGINEEHTSATFYSVINSLGGIFNQKDSAIRLKTIGVWAGFAYHIPGLHREGIARFMKFMIPEISDKYGLNVEVWCYSFNEEEIKTLFSGVAPQRLNIVTEKTWVEIFNPRYDIVQALENINESSDNLNKAAYNVSKADIMIPMIVSLDNVIGTGKRIFVPAHDMVISNHYEEFVEKDAAYKFRHADIMGRAENLVRNGAVFFSNCDTVRRKQVLRFVRNLEEKNTAVVYLPVNVPENIDENLLSESKVREKFKIKGSYLFYPTQIRPYKNVSLLIKAFARLSRKYKELTLVLTGNINDVPDVKKQVDENELQTAINCVGSVSEYELYSIYKYAAAVPVPSLFEGGFPWQACEALFMNVPLAVSDIDVVRERIEALGYTAENCGLCLFDPGDEEKLSEKLSEMIEDRDAAVSRQAGFAEKLLGYSWADAAKKYYKLFTSK